MNSFFRKLGWLGRRRRKEAELEEELRFHLEEEAEELQAAGLAVGAARSAARRGLGNLGLVQEDTRAAWGWVFAEQLLQDIHYALRTMRQNRAFTALAALSLALGIGANTAIFSFMDAILLRSLPVRDPKSLAMPLWLLQRGPLSDSVVAGFSGDWDDEPKSGYMVGNIFPYPAYEAMAKSSSPFSSMFGYYAMPGVNVGGRGQADSLLAVYVTGDYFRGLGVVPAAGRPIVPEDDLPAAPPVAMVSAALARRRFGGAAQAVGQSLRVNNLPVTVVGVAPAEFFGTDPGSAPGLYLPLHAALALEAAHPFMLKPKWFIDPHLYWLRVMGRLRPGADMAKAQAALAPAFRQWVATTAENEKQRASLPWLAMRPGGGGLNALRRAYSEPLYVLLILVGLILAIACANLANLMLSRATVRRREIAMRLSLGAGRGRLVRQLLTESVLLASLGGVLGVLFAVWGIRFLTVLLANGQENFTLRAALNWHVLGVAATLTLATGVVFGLAPALQATRVDVLPALKANRTAERRARFRLSLSHALVVLQIAIALPMLVGAGLFTGTLSNLEHVDIGFRRGNLLLFTLDANPAGHKEPEIASFYADLQKRFAAIPGVRDATLAIQSLVGAGHTGYTVELNGKVINTMFLTVAPHYFSTMGIPLLAGRPIDERDRPGAPVAAVANQRFVRENLGGANPLGRRLRFAGEHDIEIVGVSGDALYGDLRDATPPTLFIAYNQGAWPVVEMTYALRTAGDPLSYTNAVRQIVHQADERVPLTQVRTQAAAIDQSIGQEIVFARLCSGFALLALVIACVGLYGTVSYHVARRTGEIGIRMALGARHWPVVWMVLRGVLGLAAVGIAISVPAAVWGSTLVKSFLFGIKPEDPWPIAAAAAILLLAALAAAYAPARRASRIDPMCALRSE